MLGKEQVSTPVLSTKRSAAEPETETKQPQPDTQDNTTTALSPSQPIRRIRDLPTVHKAKRSLRFQQPLSKLALELFSESSQTSEFFRCYLEEDIVDREDIRGQVQLNSGDDDQESGEELVEQVKPYLMDMLERAILAAL
jgi:hypothetical protein